MFLQVEKNPLVYMQTNAMEAKRIAPVTSNFRINLNHVAEASTYTIKEEKKRHDLNNQAISIPSGTRVIHLEMSYAHMVRRAQAGTANEHDEYEYFFYKLVFLPGSEDQYLKMKAVFQQLTYT